MAIRISKMLTKVTLIIALLSSGSCVFNTVTTVDPQVIQGQGKKHPYHAVLLIPVDFRIFRHTASFEAREINYEFGMVAANTLPQLIGNQFQSYEVISTGVSQSTDWKDYLQGDAELPAIILIPAMVNVSSSVTLGSFIIRLQLLLQIYNRDGIINTLIAPGQGTAHLYISSELDKAGSIAMQQALLQLNNQLSGIRLQ